MKLLNFFFPIKIKFSAQTDKGQKREHNEDSLLTDKKNNLFIVADGLGGHTNGEYASSESLNILKKLLTKENTEVIEDHHLMSEVNYDNAADVGTTEFPEINQVFHAIDEANHFIHEKNLDIIADNKKPMGTTISGCWFFPKRQKAILFNVGDSRIYLFRQGQFIQKSHDHSLLQYWLDNGQKGEKPNANVIIRAIGPKPNVHPDIELTDIERGDTWLICSDGLHGMISHDDIEQFLASRLERNNLATYKNFSTRLVDKANYAGGLDNISVILIHIV